MMKTANSSTVNLAMGRGDWLMFKDTIDVELYGHKKIGTFRLYEGE